MKQKKSTIKYLKKAKNDHQHTTGGRKRPRNADDELQEEMGNPSFINLKKPNKKGSIKSHQDELQELKESDPDFFSFLEKNDQGLLHFGLGEDDEEDYDDDDDDDVTSASLNSVLLVSP
mmetsp:Transcript_18728/g.31384  ORF Transcript_18728/g.31384 Transcript_18728/m.31384 type:complete len:119 (-) Transcript_18728:216-572(-)